MSVAFMTDIGQWVVMCEIIQIQLQIDNSNNHVGSRLSQGDAVLERSSV